MYDAVSDQHGVCGYQYCVGASAGPSARYGRKPLASFWIEPRLGNGTDMHLGEVDEGFFDTVIWKTLRHRNIGGGRWGGLAKAFLGGG